MDELLEKVLMLYSPEKRDVRLWLLILNERNIMASKRKSNILLQNVPRQLEVILRDWQTYIFSE
jgi:hypothetical protein